MGYDDISKKLHGDYCRFLEQNGSRKQVTLPRSYVKTYIGSIAYPIWLALPRSADDEFPVGIDKSDKLYKLGSDIRILIVSYVISNAAKMIGLIRKTYEKNPAMQMLFPEVIPVNFNKTKWCDERACINRETDFPEGTFEAGGIGGSTTSAHYDLIIEDDLIYSKKDDLTGQELQPSQDDIDKAIGWHKIASSLLVPGNHTRIINIGTRWARHDLVDYIWTREKHYKVFAKACVNMEELKQCGDWRKCTPEWSEMYDIKALEDKLRDQGSYMFSTQYLLLPISPQELLFKSSYLQYYELASDVPSSVRRFTTVDVAGWGNSKRKRHSRAVVITWGWCSKNHMWLLGLDVGRFNPTDIIYLCASHYKAFKSEIIGIESVYYQEAISHFARIWMEEGKIPWLPIRQLHPKSQSKDVRIRALEPLASNYAIHCRRDHSDFIDEFINYIPDSDTCMKDILDATAYQLDLAQPGKVEPKPKPRVPSNDPVVVGNTDDFLNWAWGRTRSKNEFGHRLVPQNVFSEVDDPYYDELFSNFEKTEDDFVGFVFN